jgi:hypothetical protein
MSRANRTISSREKKAVGVPSESRPASPAAAPMNEQDVANLAYQRWVARGCPMGDPAEDWFEAERELQAGHSSA